MWLLYDDAANEFAYLLNSYEELVKLYAKLSYEGAKLSWDLRDLEKLDPLNLFIILVIIT